MAFTEYHDLIDDVYATAAATAVLPSVFGESAPESVIDFGCGTGAWLHVCRTYGVKRLVGVDGPAGRAPTVMVFADLTHPLSLGRYDLALCLEVAEHLPESAADVIVSTLVGASDRILFSAATPGQGGAGHINEQPHAYWDAKFAAAGFDMVPVDVQGVSRDAAYWYADNLRLYVKESP
jgi:hypothetical protein